MSLSTGFEELDDHLSPSPFAPGETCLVRGGFSRELFRRLCLRAAGEGRVLVVGATHAVQPYELLEVAKREGRGKGFLDEVEVCRGFTAYQLSRIMRERLRRELERGGVEAVFAVEPLTLFLDDDVEEREREGLLERSLEALTGYAEGFGVPVALFSPRERGSLEGAAAELAEVAVSAVGEVLEVRDVPGGVRAGFAPLRRSGCGERSLRGRGSAFRGGFVDFDPWRSPLQERISRYVELFGSAERAPVRLRGQSRLGAFSGVA